MKSSALIFSVVSSLASYSSCGLTGCNERFVFDVPTAGSSQGGGPQHAGSGGALSGKAGAALGGGSTTMGASGAGGVAGGCGTHPVCPSNLRCVGDHCYPCAEDGDCMAPGLRRCDPRYYRCIACLTAADCLAGFSCDTLAGRCLPACQTKSDCPAEAHGCDEQRRVCYQCDEDRECAKSPLGPLCAVDGSGCVRCRSDSDCPDQHCDQLVGRCVECRDWHDCDSALCDPITGACTGED